MTSPTSNPETQEAPLPKRSVGRLMLQIGLFAITLVVTLFVLVFVIYGWTTERAWRSYEKAQEAKGEKLYLKQLIPKPVPDGENFAMTPLLAPLLDYTQNSQGRNQGPALGGNGFNQTDLLSVESKNKKMKVPQVGHWQLGEMTDLADWQDYYLSVDSPQKLTGKGRPSEEVLKALGSAENKEAIEELIQASKRPYAYFPVHYTDANPAAILLPHLAIARRINRFLVLSSLAYLSEKQPDQAAQRLEVSWKFMEAFQNEPILISRLVRLACWQETLQVIWEGASMHGWNADQLERIQRELEKSNFLSQFVDALQGERSFGNAMYARWLSSTSLLVEDAPNLGSDYAPEIPRHLSGWAGILIPRGWIRENQLHQNQYCDFAADALRALEPSQGAYRPMDMGTFESQQAALLQGNKFRYFMVRMLAPALGKSINRAIKAQASRDVALVGIALERYHLERGEYPKSLDALSPKWLKVVPNDVYTGNSLHYQLTPKNGFVVYSVGLNGNDDGGDWPKSMADADDRRHSGDKSSDDVVWRYADPNE